MGHGLLAKFSGIIIPGDFSSSSFTLESPYPLRKNKYSNLKTIFHIKSNYFLWTNLLENLHLAKYLLSVAATLISTCLMCAWQISSSLLALFLKYWAVAIRNSKNLVLLVRQLFQNFLLQISYVWKRWVIGISLGIILCTWRLKKLIRVLITTFSV